MPLHPPRDWAPRVSRHDIAQRGPHALRYRGARRGPGALLPLAVLSLAVAPACLCLPVDTLRRAPAAALHGRECGQRRSAPEPRLQSVFAPSTLRLKGGDGKPGAAPDPKHVILMGTVCGTILVLNEFDLLSVVLRVGLTFFLAIVFLLSGVNKTTDSFHRPTHLFLASMFPDICRKVWRPLVEKYVAYFCKLACRVVPALASYCGKLDDSSFKLAQDVASWVTPSAMMKSIGQLEIWCGMLMMISLAGTGSRGYRVPLAELSNLVLIFLMAAAVYTHLVLRDGHFLAPAVLGALLVVRLACPVPQPKKKKKSKTSPVKKSRPVKQGNSDLQI